MKEYIVLAFGDSVGDKDGREKGTVCWLDSAGKEKASFESGDSVTYLQSAKKGVIIGNDRRYTGVSHGGSENWKYVATGELTDLIPMDKLNMVMTVGKEQVSIYDMSKPHNTEYTESRMDARRVEKNKADDKNGEEHKEEPADDAQNADALPEGNEE